MQDPALENLLREQWEAKQKQQELENIQQLGRGLRERRSVLPDGVLLDFDELPSMGVVDQQEKDKTTPAHKGTRNSLSLSQKQVGKPNLLVPNAGLSWTRLFPMLRLFAESYFGMALLTQV